MDEKPLSLIFHYLRFLESISFAIECIFNISHDHEFSLFFQIIIQLKVGMEPPKISHKSIKQSARFVSQTASLTLKSPPPAPPLPKQTQSHSFLDVVHIKDRSLFIAGGGGGGRGWGVSNKGRVFFFGGGGGGGEKVGGFWSCQNEIYLIPLLTSVMTLWSP